MFRCENRGCNKLTQPRQPVNMVVLETRPQVYENKIRRGKHKGKMKRTSGTEIVKEIKVCPKCYEAMTGNQAQKARPVSKPTIVDSRPRFKDRPPRNKKWQNPRRKKKGVQAKSTKQTEKKKPIVEVIKAPVKQ